MKLLELKINLTVILFGTLFFFTQGFHAQAPGCTSLGTPAAGSIGVSLDIDFTWDTAERATGYIMRIGTSSGGVDIMNDEDLGSVTFLDLDEDLPQGSDIFVSIIPYNEDGVNGTCREVRFSTGGLFIPQCTEIINPFNGDELVSVVANITWIRNFSASGYFMSIRERDPNGPVVWNREDVGNGTNVQPPEFKPRTRYYVTVIPYNDAGSAVGCEPISFTTGDPLPTSPCAELIFPEANSTDVPLDTNLQWEAVAGVDGYLVSIGTSPGGTDIKDNEDVGSVTSLELDASLPAGTQIFVSIATYEGTRVSDSCIPASFSTIRPSAQKLVEEIPKFFTPNNDGFNDSWSVNSSEDITVETIFVFNQYGKLLVQLAPGEAWNGDFKGRALPSGSYWYAVNVTNFPRIRGYFLLKR